MPGGFGTMDEFFETLTLIQTKTITQFPIILFGTKYYRRLSELMDQMLKHETIDPNDLKLILFTDSVDEAMEHIQRYITGNYEIKPRRRSWWLLERR
jgi:predicted Rossmann-fold nucleotide-binding protein